MHYRKICKKIHADILEFLSWYVNIHFTNKWKCVQSQKSAFKVRKARPGQKNALGHRLGASGGGTGSRTPAQPPRPPGAPKQKRTIAEPLHGQVDCSFCYFCGEVSVVRDGNDGHAALFGFG